ncbi:MAG: hypothetical protein CVV00_11840 [Firmicutes bacterium HGW-Firmicutes-5]|nr:MAG: hypothetical protein CVV00_11840 [Firmicutes bacterium HGW-Firmicutes-5]
MNWWDYLLTVISIFCTVFSIRGAYKANVYYKKSKQLTIYANTNLAVTEVQKIIDLLTEMLKLSNIIKRRGVNYEKEVSKNGEGIKKSLNKIRESLPVDYCKEINVILNSGETKIELYIDGFINGEVLVDGNFIIEKDFNNCQEAFREIQLFIKKKLENLSEKLK